MTERRDPGVASCSVAVAYLVGTKPQIRHGINHTNDVSLAALNRSLTTDKWLHKQTN